MDVKIFSNEEWEHFKENQSHHIKSTLKESLDSQKKIYSNEDLCKLLGISKRTSQTWRDRKWIEFSQVGHKIYYTWDQIQSFLEKHKVEA